jgi:exopolyphosphatase/guanosine-5'-triphosphate,3'-diphosphate pyrophosphatase
VASERRRRAVLELAPLRGRLARESPLGARIVDWISVPLGVATLNQKYQDVEEDRARFALMSCEFEAMTEGFRPAALAGPPPGLQIIGTSGTITTIAASHLRLPRYSRDRVDGTWLGAADARLVIEQFLALGLAGRSRHPAIGPHRATLIVAGMAILHTLLRLWPVPRLRVADRGLREGIIYAMMNEDGVFPCGAG